MKRNVLALLLLAGCSPAVAQETSTTTTTAQPSAVLAAPGEPKVTGISAFDPPPVGEGHAYVVSELTGWTTDNKPVLRRRAEVVNRIIGFRPVDNPGEEWFLEPSQWCYCRVYDVGMGFEEFIVAFPVEWHTPRWARLRRAGVFDAGTK